LRNVLELEWGPTVKVADDLPLTSRIGTDLRTRQPKAAAKAKKRKKRSN
jgi:hypothetical protein